MSEPFDPYYRWLGIPPKDQPPNHYRLLSLELFESDPNVIESAADRQMGFLRTYQTGRHAELSQRLLNEVAAAKVCLLNPEKKAAYDAWLRQQTPSPLSAAAGGSPAPAIDSDLAGEIEQAAHQAVSKRVRQQRRTQQANFLLGTFLVGIAGLAVVLVLVLRNRPAGDDSTAKGGLTAGSPSDPTVKKAPPGPDKTTIQKGDAGHSGPGKEPGRKPPEDTPPEVGKKGPAAPDGTTPYVYPPEDSKTDPSWPSLPETAAKPGGEKQLPDSPSVPAAPPEERSVEPKTPVPPEDEQAKSRKLVAEIYGPEIGRAKTPGERTTLAKKLIASAAETSNDAPARRVLLTTARELAEKAAEPQTAFEAIEALGASFAVDVLKEKAGLLERLAKGARAATERAAAAERILALADEAGDADNYDLAGRLLKSAQQMAARWRDDGLRERALAQARQLHDARQAWSDAAKARETLRTSPEDPEANLVLGKYLAFVKQDWDGGLPRLALGSDAALKALAEQELANPDSLDAKVALANAWWDLGGKLKEGMDRLARLRAGYWYRIVLDELPEGLQKAVVQKRLEEAAALEAAAPPSRAAAKSRLRPYEGTWIVHYSNGTGRRYVIDASGNVAWGTQRGKLAGRGPAWLLDFGDDKLERLRFSPGRLALERYDPAASFPKKPAQLALGEMLNKERRAREMVERVLQGTWRVTFTDRSTAEYTFYPGGEVRSTNRSGRGALDVAEGEIVVRYGNAALDRLELRSPRLLVERFNRAGDYPHTSVGFGTGLRKP